MRRRLPYPLRSSHWLLLPCLLGALACGDEGSELGSTGRLDAGRPADGGPPADIGVAADAGSPEAGPTDTGASTDVGPGDGGSEDTGTPPTPITAPDRTWTWVPFPDSRCRNDTPTGIGVNLASGSTRAVLFLQGGNACFNAASCAITANPNGYGPADFEAELDQLAGRSAFARAAPENPFRNDHFVYVPYCTGDVHAGTRRDAPLDDQTFQFVGHQNLKLFLDRLVPTLAGVREVVLIGVSAGGFGAALNFDLVQRRFGDDVRVTLVDDSGPPMGNAFIAPCLQRHFRELWGLDEGPLARCPSCDLDPEGAFIEDFLAFLLFTYPDRNFAVLSYDRDRIIRAFWGFGQDDCAQLNGLFPPAYAGETYRAGLEDLRDRIFSGLPNGRVFLLEGTDHVLLVNDPWTLSRDGVVLSDWIEAAVADEADWGHVPSGP